MWCNHKFGEDSDGIKNCQENFCETCCSFDFGDTEAIKKNICLKKCESKQLSTEKKAPWSQCIEPTEVMKQSYLSYCVRSFLDLYFRKICIVSMCQMCCLYSPEVFKLNLNDEQVNECYTKCVQKESPKEFVLNALKYS